MKPLQNCRILYTRSVNHLPSFQEKISDLGGEVWHLPLMDTKLVKLTAQEKADIAAADILLFPSSNAVRYLFAQYQPVLGQEYVAIGEKTAESLRQHLQSESFGSIFTAPPPFNSEALLSVWSVVGKKIVILTAAGGRKLLIKHLQQQNSVQEIFCYRRFNPSSIYPKAFLTPNVITIASKSTLNNLIAIIPQSDLKLLQYQTCIAALSAAVARYAAQHRFARCIFAESAAESDQIEHICRWWNINKELSHD